MRRNWPTGSPVVTLADALLARLGPASRLGPARRLGPLGLVVLVVFAFFAGSLGGCGGRDRTNPFDPSNPDTHGSPGGLAAAGGCRHVELSWRTYDLRDLEGIRLWRLSEDTSTESLLTTEPLAPSLRSYTDGDLENGRLYTYRAEFLFEGGDHGSLEPREAEPGAALPWVGDPCGWGLSQLSADGRQFVQRVQVGTAIQDLEVDQVTGRLYAAQLEEDRVLVCDSRTGDQLDAYAVTAPTGLDWNQSLNLLVVSSFYERQVTWMALASGAAQTISTTAYPEAVALRDSSLTWIAFDDGSVQRYDLRAGAAQVVPVALEEASALADDPAGGGCWIADRGGKVVYVSDGGVVAETTAGLLEEPLDLRATGEGTCWVADYGRGMLVELDRACTELARHESLGPVAEVAVDPVSGALWTTRPDDGLVMRIRATGERTEMTLAGCPRRLSGHWTGGCAE